MRTQSHWEKIGFFSHHGICVPLSALRSKKSCGIGEFNDLFLLIDWCKENRFDCLQLLPLNDTGDDPSPYNPISSCALDPIYLSLSDCLDAGELLSELSAFTPLNETPKVNRNEVKKQKLKWLQSYFLQVFAFVSKTKTYQCFVSENSWLTSYASFMVLSQKYNHSSWQDWPKTIPHLEKKELDFHFFLQYLCFSQAEKVRSYAQSQKIFLKGDIPILLNPNSADVWSESHLFQLDLSAGAPPDYYCPLGQKWGFPVFNWEEMKQDHFQWWKQRLAIATKLYHIYRIDHVVGFFRIWAVPLDALASEGFFTPQDRSLWKEHGEEILKMMIDNCPLLPIAEDLGTIPPEIYPVLKNLGICGTKVIRWQKDQENRYIPYDQYEPFSMTTVSTCDSDTLLMWWKNSPEEAEAFSSFKHWQYHPELSSEQLLELLRDAHHTPSYFHINLLQEYLSLFPELVWNEGQKERINIPGTVLPSNWTYRFRPSLEDILSHSGLKNAIRAIL